MADYSRWTLSFQSTIYIFFTFTFSNLRHFNPKLDLQVKMRTKFTRRNQCVEFHSLFVCYLWKCLWSLRETWSFPRFLQRTCQSFPKSHRRINQVGIRASSLPPDPSSPHLLTNNLWMNEWMMMMTTTGGSQCFHVSLPLAALERDRSQRSKRKQERELLAVWKTSLGLWIAMTPLRQSHRHKHTHTHKQTLSKTFCFIFLHFFFYK